MRPSRRVGAGRGAVQRGLLAAPWPGDDAFFDYGPAPAPVLARARRLATACERGGAGLPQAATVAVAARAVASVVVGIRTAGRARADVGWATDPVPGPVWTELDAVY